MKTPQFRPMLASSDPLGDETGFIHEIKWDGYRALSYIGDDVQIVSRNGRLMTRHYPELIRALEKFPSQPVVIDGEIITLDRNGRPQFSLLQQRSGSQASGDLVYVVFDILYYRGEDICSLPWRKRRERLDQTVKAQPRVAVSPVFDGKLTHLLNAVSELHLEGVISKQVDSPYLPGQRSRFWRKIKPVHTRDCVVGGLSIRRGQIRSILVGQYSPAHELLYMGRVGSGMTETEFAFLKEACGLLGTETTPFSDHIQHSDVVWLKPQIVVEVQYLELTPQGRLRHPVFLRFRWDKDPRDCLLKEG